MVVWENIVSQFLVKIRSLKASEIVQNQENPRFFSFDPISFFQIRSQDQFFDFWNQQIFEYLKNWNFQDFSTKIAIFLAQIQENLEKTKISGKNILFLPPATLNLSKENFSDNHGRNFIAKCTISAKLRLSFANVNLLISIGNP